MTPQQQADAAMFAGPLESEQQQDHLGKRSGEGEPRSRRAKRGITCSEEAVKGKAQHTKPCHDCPMRRNALPGWLGGSTPHEYRTLCHSDAPVDCHAIRGTQCAGVAIYRTNVVQRADFRLPADRDAVFATPTEFVEWHTNQGESFATLRERAKVTGAAQ